MLWSCIKKGRISLSRAADMLGVGTSDITAIAGERGIRIGATEEQQKKVEKLQHLL